MKSSVPCEMGTPCLGMGGAEEDLNRRDRCCLHGLRGRGTETPGGRLG